jgi:hypothetical protein
MSCETYEDGCAEPQSWLYEKDQNDCGADPGQLMNEPAHEYVVAALCGFVPAEPEASARKLSGVNQLRHDGFSWNPAPGA